ncbi:hypothetical protein HDE_12481 [Halotydeus destructor]|nr:hypothetical protein HDE_12481 [Halotydeus destructor]
MITPDLSLKPNEVSIPYEIYRSLLGSVGGFYTIINRMPSIQPESITGNIALKCNSGKTIGIPLEITKGMNADFDGDCVNLYAPRQLSSQIEIASLLSSKNNIGSFTTDNGLKLSWCNDIDILAKRNHQQVRTEMKRIVERKMDSVVDSMWNLNKSMQQSSETEVYGAFSWNDLLFGWRTGTLEHLYVGKVTREHIAQICDSLGHQYHPQFSTASDIISDKAISSSFFSGLTPFHQLVHAQSAFNNMIVSTKDVWMPGATQKKIVQFVTDSYVTQDSRFIREKQVNIGNAEDHIFIPNSEVLIKKLISVV